MDYHPVATINISEKLTSGTKEIFDTTLKLAMKKADELKTNNVQDKILEQASHDVETNNEIVSKSFIINKYLDDSNLKTKSNMSSSNILPIPMPRKRKTNLTAKIRDSSCNSSLLSQKTYVIEVDSKNKVQNNSTEADNSSIHGNIIQTKACISSKHNSKLQYESDSESIVSATGTSEAVNVYRIEYSNGDNSGEITENVGNNIVSAIKSEYNPCEIKSENNIRDKYKKVVEMIIHKTDDLQLNSYITYPAVKIHIVDMNTGKYYPKSNRKRPVVFYYENEEQDYILPIMTGSYNLQKKRTFNPIWEESVILNEDFNYLTNENVIIFFELVDNIPVSSRNSDKLLQKYYMKGWHRIAFAFVKPIGKGQFFNFNKKLKLQLYHQKHVKKQEVSKCDMWDLWKTNKLKKYPSALYVTVKEICCPKKVTGTFRSRTPLQKESVLSYKQNNSHKHKGNEAKNVTTNTSSRCSREHVQVPNKYFAKIDTNEHGCFLIKFSNKGLYLACVVQIEETFTVIVYLVESFEEINSFNEHCGFIYNLTWSLDDSLLLTASADNTVAVWNFQAHNFEQILPHPMYVYTCHISSDNSVIVTGCFDTIIRIWIFNEQDKKYDLHQEMKKHNGYITSVYINKKTTNLYSSDSHGHISNWKNSDKSEWMFERDMTLPDFRNTVINEILLFPNEKKMLVHTRDNILRIISIKRICVLYWLHGAFNSRVQTFCTISPCGNYVSSGSENGLIIVWNAKTGKHLTTYDPFSNSLCSHPIHSVQFHPKDNIIALSHYGSNMPILLCHCDEMRATVTEEQEKIAIKNIAYEGENVKNARSVNDKNQKFNINHILHRIDKILKE